MATSNSKPRCTPRKRKLSHFNTDYDYSSPIFKKANESCQQNTGPSDFKYYPVLSKYHLTSEVYHDSCWALKGCNTTDQQWWLHLSTPHNYPCTNTQCHLEFVELSHRDKHIPICKASLLLMANRKQRTKEIHKNLINFAKNITKTTDEHIWITCYPNPSYVCPHLLDHKLSYIDPKNHPPIPIHECYFTPIHNNKLNLPNLNECPASKPTFPSSFSMPLQPPKILHSFKKQKLNDLMECCSVTQLKSSPISCKKKKKIDLIDLIDDSDYDEWSTRSLPTKFCFIFHPFHIYSVSQQFTDKSRKNRNIKCFKMKESNARFSEKELCKKWESIQGGIKPLKTNSFTTFNGSEISFEFLNFVQIVPSENEVNETHIIPSIHLYEFVKELFNKDTQFEYLSVYNWSFCNKMRSLLMNINNELSFASQIFLYSFLRCGVGFLSKGFDADVVQSSLYIHDRYYEMLNHHFSEQSVYKNVGVRDIAFKKENSCFKEFVFRHHHKIEDWSNCTLDLSLKMGGVSCHELENLLEQSEAIQSLKTLYNWLYPTKQLRLVNIGFFQSPPTNPGQNWHSDYSFTNIHDEYTQLSPVVTVIISLVKQEYHIKNTTGSTVFCLGSNHSPTQIINICKKYPNECKDWLYRVIQPILDKGDIVCFAGNVMHFGGAYNYITSTDDDEEDRVVLYGVLHLLPKNAKHDEYLETDMNITNGQKVESIFSGGRFTIIRNDGPYNKEDVDEDDDDINTSNPYIVKKSRWIDRNRSIY